MTDVDVTTERAMRRRSAIDGAPRGALVFFLARGVRVAVFFFGAVFLVAIVRPSIAFPPMRRAVGVNQFVPGEERKRYPALPAWRKGADIGFTLRPAGWEAGCGKNPKPLGEGPDGRLACTAEPAGLDRFEEAPWPRSRAQRPR